MITFKCSGCGQVYTTKDEFAGRVSKCHKCNTSLTVPARNLKRQPITQAVGPRADADEEEYELEGPVSRRNQLEISSQQRAAIKTDEGLLKIPEIVLADFAAASCESNATLEEELGAILGPGDSWTFRFEKSGVFSPRPELTLSANQLPGFVQRFSEPGPLIADRYQIYMATRGYVSRRRPTEEEGKLDDASACIRKHIWKRAIRTRSLSDLLAGLLPALFSVTSIQKTGDGAWQVRVGMEMYVRGSRQGFEFEAVYIFDVNIAGDVIVKKFEKAKNNYERVEPKKTQIQFNCGEVGACQLEQSEEMFIGTGNVMTLGVYLWDGRHLQLQAPAGSCLKALNCDQGDPSESPSFLQDYLLITTTYVITAVTHFATHVRP